jgi:RNA recognition motif-containing protein
MVRELERQLGCSGLDADGRQADGACWSWIAANLHLPKDRVSMSHQGFGFCEFMGEADAEYACRIMNGIKLFGKPIRVNKVCTSPCSPRSRRLALTRASSSTSVGIL